MIHLSRLLCILQILKSMLVASQHFFSLSKLLLRGYIYIYPSLKPYILFYSIYWTGTYPIEFLFQGLMLWIDLMSYQCWILLVDFNFMCFSLAKKNIFHPKKWPIFRARWGIAPSPQTVIVHSWDDNSLCFPCARFKNFYNNWPVLFFVCHLEFMQIWT